MTEESIRSLVAILTGPLDALKPSLRAWLDTWYGPNRATDSVDDNGMIHEPAGSTSGGRFTGKEEGSRENNPSERDESGKNENGKYIPGKYEPDEKKWPMPTKDMQKAEWNRANKERAQQAVDKVMSTHSDVMVGAVSRKLGPICIPYGRPDSKPGAHDGYGLVHIEKDHDGSIVAKVPEIIAYGKIYHDRYEQGAYLFVHNDFVMSVKPLKSTGMLSLTTCYEDAKKALDYRSRGGHIENNEEE